MAIEEFQVIHAFGMAHEQRKAGMCRVATTFGHIAGHTSITSKNQNQQMHVTKKKCCLRYVGIINALELGKGCNTFHNQY